MALDAELARIGVTGAVQVGLVGVTMPVALAAFGTGWSDLGYISDEGVTEGLDEDSQTFVPWQAAAPIRVEVTRSVTTFQFTCWETNFNTISLYYRVDEDEITETGLDSGIFEFETGIKPTRQVRAFGIDVIDGDTHRRKLLPYAEITERGELTYQSAEMIAYPLTITAYPGSDGVAVKHIHKEGWALPA